MPETNKVTSRHHLADRIAPGSLGEPDVIQHAKSDQTKETSMEEVDCHQHVASGLDLTSPEVIAMAEEMGYELKQVPDSGQSYDILGTEWEVVAGVPSDNVLGYMNAMVHQIQLKADTPPSWRLYLLLHETLHCLTFLGHLQFLRCETSAKGESLADDEAKVDAIASALSAVLRSNNLVNEEKLAQLCGGH